MRIAIYHNLPSGGGKRALYELARRLSREHELHVFTLSCAEHDFGDLRPYAARHTGYPFAPLPLSRPPFGRLNQGIRTLDLLRLNRLQVRIASEIDAAAYDVAFVHNCQYGQAPFLLRFLQTPSVYYCAEPPRLIYEPPVKRSCQSVSRASRFASIFDPLPGLYRRTLKRLDRLSALAASRILVNSAFTRETLWRVYGVEASVGYLGVDTDLFRPMSGAREDYVLSVGALNPQKGFDFVIRSLARIEAAQRPRLVIVCNAENPVERAYLTRLAHEQEVSLTIHSLVSDDELAKLYGGALVTVYAPIMEPFGLVPLESMACGTPVIGVREAGVRETVVDGRTGLLTERDLDAFAAAVDRLLTDHSLRRRLAHEAVAHVRDAWSWDRSAERIVAFLSMAAREGHRGL